MRASLIEPFFGGSHRAWAEGWRDHSRHELDLLTMEASAWRWRMRGAAVTLAPAMLEQAARVGRPDAIVVSDMVDLSSLLALTRRELAPVPVALYLHENQLTYPRQPGEPLDHGLAWITWHNLVVADAIWCNSVFHRDELLATLPEFLGSVPDHDHLALLETIASRMRVIPVGVELERWGGGGRAVSDVPLILCNQRWHHDKDVGAVVRALIRLAGEGLEFRVAVVGDDKGGEGDEVHALLDQLGDRVVVRGHLGPPAYEALLETAEIVVSAARNEFFGIAVVEAVAAGAVPVLPRALAYPETMPVAYHHAILYEPGQLGTALRQTLVQLPARRAATVGLAESMQRFDWSEVAPLYDTAVDELVAAGRQEDR
jgi:glycosyltransferase involved in cell wall biosynthesis